METASKNWELEDYSKGGMNLIRLGDSISLGILAEVDKEYFEDLAKTMNKKKHSDFIMDYLVNSQLPDYPIGEKLKIEDNKPIIFFAEIIKIQDKTEAIQKLRQYLDKYYYTSQNLDYYFNIHKFNNGKNYYGYWCWEAGALVKIKNLNDSSLRNHPYYPYDFVHWKNTNKPQKHTFLGE